MTIKYIEAILSNIINNATEAMASMPMQDAYVEVSSRLKSQTVEIIIKDNGPGFSKRFLKPGGIKRGNSVKINGNGIGLASARERLISWGAELQISNRNFGAQVSVVIPICSEQSSDEQLSFNLSQYEYVVILDDNRLMHELWNIKIREVYPDCKIHNFLETYSFDTWIKKNKGSNFFLISDYSLGPDCPTGLQIINKLNHKDSVLISGHDIQHIEKNSKQRLPTWLSYVNKEFLHTRISFENSR